MVSLLVSLVLVVVLTLVGLLLGYDAITQHDILPFVGSALATGLGLVWLWVLVNEWRAMG
jgi:hypothetical protein